MSLRDKLEREKAESAAEKLAGEEKAKAEKSEGRRAELDGLLKKRQALAEIKTAAANTTEEVAAAKTKLKGKRAVLRSLHKDSINEETGEASIPAPIEVLRDDELREEDEVVEYNNARDEFRLSANAAKGVQAQLTELGIDNSAKLKPSELEVMLVGMQKDVDAATQTFVLEHPDVDPEMTARIKEELVSSRKAEILKSPWLRGESSGHKAFYRELSSHVSRRDRSPLETSLHDATTALSRSPQDIKAYVGALTSALGNKTGPISAIDREGVERAVAENIVRGGEFSNTLSYQNLRAALSLPTNNERKMSGDEYQSDKEHCIQMAAEVIQDSPNLKMAVEALLENYQEVTQFRAIPGEINRLQAREEEVRDLLSDYSRNLHGKAIRGREQQLNRKESDYTADLQELDNELRMLRLASISLKTTLDSLSDENLSTRVGIHKDILNEKNVLNVDELLSAGQIQNLRGEIATTKDVISELNGVVKVIEDEKNGMFGPSRDKKERLERLGRRIVELGAQNPDSGKIIQAAKSLVTQLEVEAKDKASEITRLTTKDRELQSRLSPINTYAHLFGDEGYESTLGELLTKAQALAAEELPRKEVQRTEKAKELEDTIADQSALAEEKRELEKEKATIFDTIRKLQARQDDLKRKVGAYT
jgi:hypothetical protein